MPDFSSPSPQGLSDLAWLTLLHSAWLGMLAGAIGSMAAGLGRPASHRARHAAFVVGLAAVAAIAPAAAVVQRAAGRREVVPSTVHTMIQAAAPLAAPSPSNAVPTVAPPRVATAPQWGASLRRAVATAGPLVAASRAYLLAGWAAVASASAATLLVGGFASRRLRREAVPCPALASRARVLARRLRLRRVPAIKAHPRIVEPCLAGVVRPMVLLPSRWLESAPAAEVVAVLAHELAHARRLDQRTNLLQRAIEVAFGVHPGVRRLSRLARREAEHAADALAARVTGDPIALARALDSVARMRPSRSRPPSLGLAIGGDRSTLLPRIQELLGMKPNRPRFPLGVLFALPTASALAFLAISTAPAQEPVNTLGTIDIRNVTLRQFDAPPDAAMAAWEERVQELRARVENPDSPEYAMGVLYRLVPGNPRLAMSDFVDRRPRAELAPGDLPDDVLIRLASKRPWRLSHEDLVTLVRTMPHGRRDVAGLSREDLLHITDENQVCFEIRYFQVLHDPAEVPNELRDTAHKLVQPVPGSMLPLTIETLMRQFPNAAKQGPKVTTFEGGAAVISLTDEPTDEPMDERRMKAVQTAVDRFDNEVRLAANLKGPAPGPEDDLVLTSRLHGELAIQLTGIRKSWGHAVEARLLGVLPGDPKVPDAVPRTVERLVRLNVPEGDGFILDTGIYVYGTEEDHSGKHLRTLIVITPRHIPNDRESEAIDGPVDGFRAVAR